MVRAFESRLVPPELVDRLLDLARRAPSAGNTQPWAFVVLEGDAARELWNVTLDAERRASFRWQRLLDAPVVVLALVSPDAYVERYGEPDKRATGLGAGQSAWPVPYWWVDGGMAVQTLLLAATDAGLGALFYGLFDHEGPVLDRVGVPPRWRGLGAVELETAIDLDATTNRRVVLRRRPEGLLTKDDVELQETVPLAGLDDGEALLAVDWIGIDATVRTWLSKAEGYLPAVEIGEAVRARGIRRGVATRGERFPLGHAVYGLPGWQRYGVVQGDRLPRRPDRQDPRLPRGRDLWDRRQGAVAPRRPGARRRHQPPHRRPGRATEGAVPRPGRRLLRQRGRAHPRCGARPPGDARPGGAVRRDRDLQRARASARTVQLLPAHQPPGVDAGVPVARLLGLVPGGGRQAGGVDGGGQAPVPDAGLRGAGVGRRRPQRPLHRRQHRQDGDQAVASCATSVSSWSAGSWQA